MDSNRGEYQDGDEPIEETHSQETDNRAEGIPPAKPKKKKSAASKSSSKLKARGRDAGIVPAGRTIYFDLSYNVAAALCYFAPLPVLGILWLATENKNNRYLRFHAIQSLILTGSLIGISVIIGTIGAVFDLIPVIGPVMGMIFLLLRALLAFIFMGICVRMMFSVYKGKEGRFPLVANWADKFMEPSVDQ